jgi:hypothetical protein
MSQIKKLTDAEFSEIKMLQGKFQESTFKLGTLQIEKMELDRLVSQFVENEKRLKDEWQSLQKLERSLLDKIVEKYGEGNLNMVDGTFVSNTPVVTQEEQRKV